MFSWIEFLLANALTTVNAKPIAGIMTRAGNVNIGDFALIAAASVIGLIPGVALVVFMRNHLARGFSMGRIT
jgi:glycerol transport system permease protein